MSEFVAILAVWIGLFVVPALGVVAGVIASRTGRWPWQYGVGPGDVVGAMTAEGREYLAGWRQDRDDGEVANRVGAFILSLGLLWRASVHSLVGALSYPDGVDDEVDHAMTWTPLQMDWIPLTTARALTFGTGLVFIFMAPTLRWGWPIWAEWLARAYVTAQAGVWLAEPIAILRDHVK